MQPEYTLNGQTVHVLPPLSKDGQYMPYGGKKPGTKPLGDKYALVVFAETGTLQVVRKTKLQRKQVTGLMAAA